MGSGHTVTALYEVIPAGIETDFLGKVNKLKYQQQPTITSNNGAEIMTIKFRYKKPDQDKSLLIEHTVINNPVLFSATSDNFRFASAVAQFGMLLRNSEFKQNASFMKAWKTASSAIGKDTEGYRGEFLKIVKKAQSLAGNKSETEEDDEDISKR